MIEDKYTRAGLLIEIARKQRRMSQRKAAAAAGISEGWWRQVVEGIQRRGGIEIPVNPSFDALVAMAQAVGANVNEVLEAAGIVRPADHVGPPPDLLTASDPSPRRRLRFIRDEIDRLITQMEGASNAQVTESQQSQGSPQASGESGESGAPIGVSVEHLQAIMADESLTSAERNRRVSALMEQLSVAPGSPKTAGGGSARAGA